MLIFSKLIERKELLSYIIIGTLVTALDWAIFAITLNWLGLHYQLCLVLGFIIGGITHYSLNKLFTFKCRSTAITSQFSVYILMISLSLLCNMGVMALLVNWLAINKIILRITTTLIMVMPNYLVHKYISFSKKIFTQPELPH